MKPTTYEYAGFVYSLPDFKPLPGQHPAAAKDRHRRAARACWEASSGAVGRKPHSADQG